VGAWRRTPARGDVMNDDESLDSDYEDESLSSKQLAFSPESDLSEFSSISTAKSNSTSLQKAGRKAVWRKNVITNMVDIICSSKYLRTNSPLALPCIRLTRGKFELTNHDLAGGKNSSVLM